MFAFMRGAAIRRKTERELVLWGAWHAEVFARQKRLDQFATILKRLNGPVEMTPKQQRATILGIAQAMGARVIHRKKGDEAK